MTIVWKALEWLQKETPIRVGQHFRCVGGSSVNRQVLNECFNNMGNWVAVAKEAMMAEWPDFECVRSFSVFQLKPKLATCVIKKDLKKLTHIFNEKRQLEALTRSFTDCLYTAEKKRSLALAGCQPSLSSRCAHGLRWKVIDEFHLFN